MAPLAVTSSGPAAAGVADGQEITVDARALWARALDDNAVVVAQVTPFFD